MWNGEFYIGHFHDDLFHGEGIYGYPPPKFKDFDPDRPLRRGLWELGSLQGKSLPEPERLSRLKKCEEHLDTLVKKQKKFKANHK